MRWGYPHPLSRIPLPHLLQRDAARIATGSKKGGTRPPGARHGYAIWKHSGGCDRAAPRLLLELALSPEDMLLVRLCERKWGTRRVPSIVFVKAFVRKDLREA